MKLVFMNKVNASSSGGKPLFLTCSLVRSQVLPRIEQKRDWLTCSSVRDQVLPAIEQVRKRGLPPLLLVFCLLTFSVNVFAQLGQPGPSSPLYGARTDSGNSSTGLPKALNGVGLDQKLD